MGLWLKCPACQAKNPLDLKACVVCNASLVDLPLAKRVYVLEPAGSAPPKAPKAAKPAKPSKPAAPPAAGPLSTLAPPQPPSKKAKGPKAARKKP